jgi:peptide/nickel transport system permease protein
MSVSSERQGEKKALTASKVGMFWRQYSKNRAAVAGLFLLAAICVIAIAAPVITWYPPLKSAVGNPFVPPTANHPFGTDDLGRDIYSNVVYGARTSLVVGLLAAGISALTGIFVGATSGYYGGKIDDLLMRISEIFLVLPTFLLALIIVAVFGTNINNIIVAIAIVSWPRTARLLRAEFLTFKEREFVEAARVLGSRHIDIMLSEILPNAIFPVIVNASLEVATAILTEAGLSFLGAGDPNVPSWGLMLNNAQSYLRVAWWMAAFPGAMLLLTCLSLNLVGDGLNDYFNPRLKER